MPARTRTRPALGRLPETGKLCQDIEPTLLQPGLSVTLKRGFDLFVSLLICIPALPLILFCSILVKLTSRGPIFYSQVRLGLNGRPFWIYKIRSMVVDSEKNGACWSQPGDPRVTKVGRFLRKTHLDELPQLWNVLNGDMSLVGPRPERPEFVPSLEQAVPRYRDRLLVRPGLTGLAQVQLPPDSDLESVRRKVACDLYYIGRLSLWLDFRLIFVTAFYLLGQSCQWPCRLMRIPMGQRIADNYDALIRQRELEMRLEEEQRQKESDPALVRVQAQPQTA